MNVYPAESSCSCLDWAMLVLTGPPGFNTTFTQYFSARVPSSSPRGNECYSHTCLGLVNPMEGVVSATGIKQVVGARDAANRPIMPRTAPTARIIQPKLSTALRFRDPAHHFPSLQLVK